MFISGHVFLLTQAINMNTKIIKGQAWISGNSLLQDQTLVGPNGVTSSNTVALIENIWDELLSPTSTCKRDQNYIYWEVTVTSIDDEHITVRVECPRPKDGIFTPPYDPSTGKSEWSRYWLGKLKEVSDRAQETCTIQPKEYLLADSEYIEPGTGIVKKVEKKTIVNSDLGDVTNLLFHLQ